MGCGLNGTAVDLDGLVRWDRMGWDRMGGGWCVFLDLDLGSVRCCLHRLP